MSVLNNCLLDELENDESARHEIKFVLSPGDLWRVKRWINTHELNFKTAFPDRRVNSIYLDSWNFLNYSENVSGMSERSKMRIRWYGTGVPDRAILEVKLRRAHTGYKLHHPILDEELVRKIIAGNIRSARGAGGWMRRLQNLDGMDSRIASTLSELYPNIEIRYERAYYESLEADIRVTLDTDIGYRRYGSRMNFAKDPSCICEIKMPIGDDVGRLFRHKPFPLRASRNSKYCRAVYSVCKEMIPIENFDQYLY